MIDGSLAFLQQNDPPDPQSHPGRFQTLVTKQNAISWINFVRGCWSLEWAQIQCRCTSSNQFSGKQKKSNKNWVPAMIRILWEQFMALWTQRNIDEHGSDHDTRQQAKRKTLCHKVTFACATKDDQPNRSQHLFEIPLKHI